MLFILVSRGTYKKSKIFGSSGFSSKIVGLIATSLILLVLLKTLLAVASAINVHYCLKWDLKHFLVKCLFSAQLVSAQRSSGLFLFS